MGIPGAGAPGPGRRGARALAVALLCLHPLLLHSQMAWAEKCGKPSVSGKIFGGRDAPEMRWPWQAALYYQGIHICGAVLINTSWVASAAHCFQKSHNPADYQVLLGYHRLKTHTAHGRTATVYRLFVHTDFNKHYFMGRDITLLQLHRPMKISTYIQPACLPNSDMHLPSHCWITGWGMVTEEVMLGPPYTLQEAEVGILESNLCKLYFQGPGPEGSEYSIHEDMFCAADFRTGKSVCRGDSGGPLVCKLNNTWYLMGLSSWSLPCQQPIGPSVFTRITYFSQWIARHQAGSPPPKPSDIPPEDNRHPQSSGPPTLTNVTSLGNVPQPRSFQALVTSQVSCLLLTALWML
ncbi:serine protease 40 isoform X2 [Vicugna pacos]|uniref:Serine protease 40 isoform X2 n=1 Tax=Vicugna pacos TaxID=30538 RepID=A0ABM5DB93_VICPA